MKSIATAIVAFTLLTSVAEARPLGGIFTDVDRTSPRSVFDDIQISSPRSIFVEIGQSAPRAGRPQSNASQDLVGE